MKIKNKIAVWDLRKLSNLPVLKEPVLYIEEPKPIKKIEFCPSKAGRLAVLSEHSSNIKVYRLEEKNDYLVSENVQCKLRDFNFNK